MFRQKWKAFSIVEYQQTVDIQMFRQKWKAFSIVEYQQTVQILVVYAIIANTLLVIGQNKHF